METELDPQYPRKWSDYIGQDTAKRSLMVAARAAKKLKQPLDHVLIAHPTPGIGKTALGHLVAATMGTNVKVISGPVHRDKARMILSQMEDRDVLVYDEFHQIMDNGRKNAEWFLTYAQDAQIAGPLGTEQYPRVTFVCCTTDAYKLPNAIVSRLIEVPMEDYTADEAAKIATKLSRGVFGDLEMPPLRRPELLQLAAAAHNNPRTMRNLLKQLRNLTITGEMVHDGRYDLAKLFDFAGVTPDGLDRVAQNYLLALYEFGGKAGAKTLGDALAQPGGLALTEKLLFDKKLIGKTTTGRVLTRDGINRAQALMQEVAA